ncbi:hypothetical protein OIDMADRAFT_170908 [Oidiodendron maius Zn]|uniref:Major facilitator superfamily (MFS) profile domain-containing protein n=1 Tax=Oidiodendron maius (strain Zn) TaxID=913774 RepID=A0A0C3H128_OIDMZ|nr:hypothetical protein OIDMADRAFT_170908 [Oidiodendron maius Zn]
MDQEKAVGAHPIQAVETEGNQVSDLGNDATEIQSTNEVAYPTGVKLATITIAVALSVLLVALDNTIIGTAIPRISDEFHALGDVGWYGSAYFLTTCATQLLFGKIYTHSNVKIVYLVAIALFELGSLVCGAAPTSTSLIIGRAIAGLGSAGIFIGGVVIITHSVALVKRPIYVGIVGAMYGIASVVGPLMGGVFTDHLSWRWCFYINLPIGGVTFIGIALFFKAPQMIEQTATFKSRLLQLDPLGTVIFMPSIICLLLALQWGGTTYPWGSARIIVLLVIFVILIIGFIIVQVKSGDNATTPPRIISQRSMAFGCWYTFSLSAAYFIALYYLPIWFQAIKGASPVHSGLMNLPMLLGVVSMAMISGVLITLIGYYVPFMIMSTAVAAIGIGLISTLELNSGSNIWIGFEALFGLGIGAGLMQAVLIPQTVLSINDTPTGTAAIIFFQTLGGAIMISVAQNVFQNRLLSNLNSAIPGLNLTPEAILGTGATNLRDIVPQEYLLPVLTSLNKALSQTFYVGVAGACVSVFGCLGLEWRSVKTSTGFVTSASV